MRSAMHAQPEVAIKVGPKTYPVRCAEGEQERIAALGALVVEYYARLGKTRAPLEANNLLFTALFMADELTEAKAIAQAAQGEIDAARKGLESALAKVEQERTRITATREELEAEIETVRKAEARAREDITRLKAELAEVREANANQHDLFGAPAAGPAHGPANEDALAAVLEALADKVEATASAIESAAQSPQLEETADKD